MRRPRSPAATSFSRRPSRWRTARRPPLSLLLASSMTAETRVAQLAEFRRRRVCRARPRCGEWFPGRDPASQAPRPRHNCAPRPAARSGRSVEIRTTTISGWSALSLRLASIPLISGMWTSIRTRSGSTVSAATIASAADDHLADRLEPRHAVDHFVGHFEERLVVVDRQHPDRAAAGCPNDSSSPEGSDLAPARGKGVGTHPRRGVCLPADSFSRLRGPGSPPGTAARP